MARGEREVMLRRDISGIGLYVDCAGREWTVLDARRVRVERTEYLAWADGERCWIRAGAFRPTPRSPVKV